MPTRKQKRRDLKSKRHDYEFVYVDGEGNELDEVPEEIVEQKKERTNGAKPATATKKQPPQRGRRVPQPPSWTRAAKRSALFGVALVVLFSFGNKGNIVKAVPTAVAFTLFYIPIMYYIDRMAYRRWQARQGGGTTSTKKR
jgi:hypothetical protein